MRTTVCTIVAGMAALCVLAFVGCHKTTARTAVEQGKTAHERRDFDLAIRFFTEAIQLDAKNANAHSRRGVSYRSKGDNDKAIADFTEAIRLDPKFAKAYCNRGTTYSMQRRTSIRRLLISMRPSG